MLSNNHSNYHAIHGNGLFTIPLVNCSLEVLIWPRHPANAVTVQHPDGEAMKIPLWMLQPEAAHFHLSEQIEITVSGRCAASDNAFPVQWSAGMLALLPRRWVCQTVTGGN